MSMVIYIFIACYAGTCVQMYNWVRYDSPRMSYSLNNNRVLYFPLIAIFQNALLGPPDDVFHLYFAYGMGIIVIAGGIALCKYIFRYGYITTRIFLVMYYALVIGAFLITMGIAFYMRHLQH